MKEEYFLRSLVCTHVEVCEGPKYRLLFFPNFANIVPAFPPLVGSRPVWGRLEAELFDADADKESQ